MLDQMEPSATFNSWPDDHSPQNPERHPKPQGGPEARGNHRHLEHILRIRGSGIRHRKHPKRIQVKQRIHRELRTNKRCCPVGRMAGQLCRPPACFLLHGSLGLLMIRRWSDLARVCIPRQTQPSDQGGGSHAHLFSASTV